MRSRISWSVVFIASALLALAAVPVWRGDQLAEQEQRIFRALLPARTLATDLSASYAGQNAAFRVYLLARIAGGQDDEQLLEQAVRARDRYRELVAAERALNDSLEAVLDLIPLEVEQPVVSDVPDSTAVLDTLQLRTRGLQLRVVSAAQAWQLEHVRPLDLEEDPAEYMDALDVELEADQARYDAIRTALDTLLTSLDDQLAATQDEMDSIRRRQGAITVVLILLALGATLAVGRLARRLYSAVDESVRRRQEAVEARREIDAVLAATAEAVLGLDLAGRVISVNRTAVELLGFSETDAHGRPFHEVLHAGAPGEHETASLPEARAVTRALSEGTALDGVDGQVHPRPGGVVEVRWSLRPLVDGTQIRGAVLTLTDMREVREADRALRRAVKAREETMAVVGHDLRSPLSTVAAAAELLLDVPLPEARRRHQLESIQSAAERMNHLISDLMDLARIEAGGLAVHLREAELGPLLDRALRLAEPQASKRGVALVRSGDTVLPRVRLDDHRVLQALSNLIANALRYTEAGGRVEVGATTRPFAVEVWVEDTGSGIEEPDLERLWDPFWQPDRDRRARQEGAGLGLAIVKGVVQAHGGRVAVESWPDEGSRFSFTLPRLRPEDAGATPPGGPPGSS